MLPTDDRGPPPALAVRPGETPSRRARWRPKAGVIGAAAAAVSIVALQVWVWSATHAALHAWASPPRPGPDLGTFIASCLAAALGALLVTAAYVVGRRAPRKRFERHARAVLARISRMATARVADAAPGVVRIRGRVRALGGDPVVATVRRDGTRTALPFCVVDETGEVRVEGGAIELWDGVSADAELRAGDEVEVAGVLARRYEPSGELDGYRARRVEHVLVRNEEDPVHVVQRWRARR